jgi:beta-carotene ketolase (CrtW type)
VVQSEQAFLQSIKPTSRGINEGTNTGLLIAFTIIGLWASNLIFLLSLDISKIQPFWIILAIAIQTFLSTGLFITAHDAMHGVVVPHNPKANTLIGSIAVLLYGLFSYKELLKKHWLHHHHPASELDPDFHDTRHKNFFAWYFHFMKGYWSWTQMIGLMLLFNGLKYTLPIPEINLTLFWGIPPILSSVQLFYFGTFLTHREPEGGYTNRHRTQSSSFPVLWSFITCYHFGYHQEHHECPHVPWWKLPEVYKMNQDIS